MRRAVMMAGKVAVRATAGGKHGVFMCAEVIPVTLVAALSARVMDPRGDEVEPVGE